MGRGLLKYDALRDVDNLETKWQNGGQDESGNPQLQNFDGVVANTPYFAHSTHDVFFNGVSNEFENIKNKNKLRLQDLDKIIDSSTRW